MKLPVLLALLSVLPLLAAPKDAPVSLHVDAHDNLVLKPSSAFEVRFAEPMVPADAVGKPDRESPLVIRPAMTGGWRWVSTQSGIFQPTEPPPLGATYQVTLAGGLKTADGKAFRGTLNETFRTPAFRVKAMNMMDYFDDKDAPAQPKVMLLFSANVDPAAIGANSKFVDADRRSIDATVRHLEGKDGMFPTYRADDRSALTWDEQVREHLAGGPKKAEAEDEDDDNTPQAAKEAVVFKNQLLVTPANPLPPGKGWRLVVSQAAPSADGAFKLPSAFEAPIGDVKPFTLDNALVENLAVSGKRVTLTFSKRLAKAVKKEPAKFVKVEPAPANLKVTMGDSLYSDDNSILVRGDFALGTDYTVTVAGETAAVEPFALGQAAIRKVSFAPVASRLVFPGIRSAAAARWDAGIRADERERVEDPRDSEGHPGRQHDGGI